LGSWQEENANYFLFDLLILVILAYFLFRLGQYARPVSIIIIILNLAYLALNVVPYHSIASFLLYVPCIFLIQDIIKFRWPIALAFIIFSAIQIIFHFQDANIYGRFPVVFGAVTLFAFGLSSYKIGVWSPLVFLAKYSLGILYLYQFMQFGVIGMGIVPAGIWGFPAIVAGIAVTATIALVAVLARTPMRLFI